MTVPTIKLRYRPSLEHLEHVQSLPRGPSLLRVAQLYGVTGLGRDPHAVATGLSAADLGLLADDSIAPVSSPESAVRSVLTETEDGRLFSPVSDNYGASSRRRSSRLVVPSVQRAAGFASRPFTLAQIQYELPSSVLVCVRRKQRRAVILAKGKGGSGHKKPRRNSRSNIWC